ncbi:hypothetical protein IKD48_02050 [bacterium]|nr:hypothetical protein [bacterium]
MNVNVASKIRTKATASLSRNISIPGMHDLLIGMFVDRMKLQEQIQEDIKPSIDVEYLTSQEYFKQQHCYHEHTNPQMKGYYKTQFGFDESDFLFIEDGGINNEW